MKIEGLARNVGTHAALGLAARGVRVTGISDHTIALHDAKGFDVKAAVAYATRHGVLKGFADAAAVSPREALTLPCDVLAPCAVERVIDTEIASLSGITATSAASPGRPPRTSNSTVSPSIETPLTGA